jgi:anti-anti-sigma regulatory factor
MNPPADGIAVVPVTKKTWRQLQSVLQSLLDTGQRGFVLDCSGLSRIDSQDLGDIAGYQIWLTRQGGALALANLRSEAVELFKMVHLDKVFRLDLDTAAAQDAVRDQLD